MRKLSLFLFAAAAILLLPAPGRADTHLSFWKNNSSCTYVIRYGALKPVELAPGQSHDFGPTPGSDPTVLGTRTAGTGCPESFKIEYMDGGFPGKKCNPSGPYQFHVTNGSLPLDRFCYCITSGWGYINNSIENTGVQLKHGPNTYACGD